MLATSFREGKVQLKFWVFLSKNGGFSPQIIHFNRVFHDFHHPFWGTSIFGSTPMTLTMTLTMDMSTQVDSKRETQVTMDGSSVNSTAHPPRWKEGSQPPFKRKDVCFLMDDLDTPRKLTWNLKMMVSNRNLLFQGFIFRFHVSFPGCIFT